MRDRHTDGTRAADRYQWGRGALDGGIRWDDGGMTLTADFAAIPDSRRAAEIERLCDAMEAADKAGCYPRLTVERPWSAHNPVLEGEFAAPRHHRPRSHPRHCRDSTARPELIAAHQRP